MSAKILRSIFKVGTLLGSLTVLLTSRTFQARSQLVLHFSSPRSKLPTLLLPNLKVGWNWISNVRYTETHIYFRLHECLAVSQRHIREVDESV